MAKEVERKMEYSSVSTSSPPHDINEGNLADENRKLKEAINSSSGRYKEMAQVETALRQEIEDILILKETMAKEVERKMEYSSVSTSSPPHDINEGNLADEIRKLKEAIKSSSGRYKEMAQVETSLRREIEDILILKETMAKEVERKMEYSSVSTSSPQHDINEGNLADENRKLKEAINSSSGRYKEMAQVETALRQEIEDILILKETMAKEVERKMEYSSVSTSSPHHDINDGNLAEEIFKLKQTLDSNCLLYT